MKRRLSVLALLVACLVTTAFTPPANHAKRADYCYESGCRIYCCDSRGFCIVLESNCDQ
jgi:hypothetical protein